MESKKYSQIAKLTIMFLLLLIAPLLSTSMRQPYLYFLLNILIIVVAAEAGLLSSFNKPPTHEEDNKQMKHQPAVVASPKPISTSAINTTNTAYFVETSPNNKENRKGLMSNLSPKSGRDQSNNERKVTYRAVEKSKSEKIVKAVKLVRLVKRIPSTPSLFFIGSAGEADHQQEVEDPCYHQLTENEGEKYQVEEIDALSGQELYSKAEMFIGNFYKQLKMQREDSWKKLHDFYHKAF
ncbi:hypothetical protein MKX01_032747 [Papaver californicum]|nr:hypothetical protein MKX01_032747 [Papaver californicum]